MEDGFHGQLLRRRALPLQELPIQYADFALWQRDRLRGPILEELLAYWKRCSGAGPERLELPTLRPRSRGHIRGGARLSVTLPSALHESLLAIGRQESATLFMVVTLAAFQTFADPLYRCA